MIREHRAGRRALTRLIVALAYLIGLGSQQVWPAPRTAWAYSFVLTGAGSTFDAPFLTVAFAAYARGKPIKISYQAVGSGAGIRLFSLNKVDFGASDVPMNGMEMALADRTGGPVAQIPVALGAVAVTYDEPKLGGMPLQLDGATLAAIYMGHITRWNDPAIARLNPTLRLPPDHILPVHRTDSSGTTSIFTTYLSVVNKEWARTVGWGKAVAWPAGFRGVGSTGVAAWVARHEGAIGYVELRYAVETGLPYARLKNAAGDFVAPTTTSVRAAAARFPHLSVAAASIVNAPGRGSYPIAAYSWVLLRRQPKAPGQGATLVHLFRWLITAGQAYARRLDYVPLPPAAQRLAATTLASIVPS